jgi:hypothetical protein
MSATTTKRNRNGQKSETTVTVRTVPTLNWLANKNGEKKIKMVVKTVNGRVVSRSETEQVRMFK